MHHLAVFPQLQVCTDARRFEKGFYGGRRLVEGIVCPDSKLLPLLIKPGHGTY